MFGIPYAWRTLRRIVVPVEKNLHPTDGPRPRGAKAVIDESTAARLSAVVGDGEFSEFAGAAHGAPEDSATTTAALIRRNTPAAAIAVATLACLWVGNRMNQSLPDTVAHAGADGGSFGEPTAAAGPMFGAGRDPGARGGDPAMNLKNSARVAVMAVTAVVTANGALAGDAVQWRVEDGGNGHWYQRTEANCWSEADSAARAQGCHLASVLTEGEAQFCTQFVLSESDGITVAIGGFRTSTSDLYLGWRWTTDEAFTPGSVTWMSGNPGCCGSDEYFLGINRVGHIGDLRDCPGLVGAILEWSADCNSDGIVDYGQILTGQLADTNTNNIPDCCEPGNSCCIGDIYVNHIIDGGDLGVLLSEWGAVTPTTNSDLNRDGFVNGADLGMLLANWGPCGG